MSIILGHALGDELDLDAPYVRALELFCLRAGGKVLSLAAQATNGLTDAAAVHRPDIVVLAGGQLPDGIAARWSSLIARAVGPTPVVFYRPPSSRRFDSVLSRSPAEARSRLVELAHAGAIPNGARTLRRQGQAIAAG